MTIGEEYRLQTWLGLFQIIIGLATWLWGGILHWALGFVTDESNLLAVIVRQAGILLLLLPLAWAIFTIRKERDQASRWSERHTIVSGILLAIFMFYGMGLAIGCGRYDPPKYYIELN